MTYWFEAIPRAEPYPVLLRLSGRRVGLTGRTQAGDQFVHDETVDVSAPGGGPVTVTVRVRGINAGEWAVTEKVIGPSRAERKRRAGRPADPPPPTMHRAAWSLRRRKLAAVPAPAVMTRPAPFALVPGLVPGIYFAMAVAGILLGLGVQTALVAHERLDVWHTLLLSTLAILVGVVGAKAWFVVVQWRRRLRNGWCIQGLLTGVTVVLVGGSLVGHIGVGGLVDLSTPGLFMGMAVGRVGCFFAGCCYGRPTASRWGIWSSDQRIGVRRLPTQLMELVLALTVGLGGLAIVLAYGPAHGLLFVGATAAYTLVRQGILLLRAERRQSVVGPQLTAAASGLVLVAALAATALVASGRVSLPA